MAFDRKLSIAQHMGYKFDMNSAFNIQVAIHGEGSLNTELLKKAIWESQKIHPTLNSYIESDSLEFKAFHKFIPIPIQITLENASQEWKRFAEEDLNRQFIHGTEPYARVRICKCGESFTLIYTLAHYIADGVSISYFAKSTLETYSLFINNNETYYSNKPPLSLAGMRIPKNMDFDYSVVLSGDEINEVNEQKYISVEDRTTKIMELCLSDEDTKAFINRCKKERTTIYGGICSGSMSALAEVISKTYAYQKPIGVSCISVVDHRNTIKNKFSSEQLGQAVLTGRTFRGHFQSNTQLWDMARESRLKLKNYQNNNGFIKLLLYIKQHLHLPEEEFQKLMEFKDEYVIVSYLGVVDSICNIQGTPDFRITNINASTSAQYLQGNEWGVFIGSYIFKGCLNFTISYVREYWDEKRAEMFLEEIKHTVRGMSGRI